MSVDEREFDSSAQGVSVDGGNLDQGRRYWKAAIAHLAPEKREAAWEFYLDRLESSAAADTLGGVMLLLEAHLAYFDEFPARLGRAAQQIEAALQTPGQSVDDGVTSLTIPKRALAPAAHRRWRDFLVASASAIVSGTLVYLSPSFSRHLGPSAPANRADQTNHSLLTGADSIRVESWNDPSTHRPRGVVVRFRRIAWMERTSGEGANVYMLSPVEEVRRDLEVLHQTPP